MYKQKFLINYFKYKKMTEINESKNEIKEKKEEKEVKERNINPEKYLNIKNLVTPYTCFGDYSKLENKRYRPINIIALEPSDVLVIPSNLLMKIIDEISTNTQFKEQTEFIVHSTPGLSRLGNLFKERISSSFRQAV